MAFKKVLAIFRLDRLRCRTGNSLVTRSLLSGAWRVTVEKHGLEMTTLEKGKEKNKHPMDSSHTDLTRPAFRV